MNTHDIWTHILVFVLGVIVGAVVAVLFVVMALPFDGALEENTGTPTTTYVDTGADEIEVFYPPAGGGVPSPLTVMGRARGGWYFEASAPMELLDGKGEKIAEGFVTAQGDWMTEEFVPFQGTLTFTAPINSDTGMLILRADNPSGLPQYDRSVEIKVIF